MRGRERVWDEAGYLLHARDWRDTSRIVDCFSHGHGRVALVARGARRASSPLRGVLQPFQRLALSWVGRGELGTLTRAESTAAPRQLAPAALIAAFYANELLLRGTAAHDPHPELFVAYEDALASLASGDDEAVVLRRFELELLAVLGYGARLDLDVATGAVVDPEAWYRLDPELGAVRIGVREDDAEACWGADLIACAAGAPPAAAARGALRRALRIALEQALGSRPLRSRAVAHALRRPRGGAA